jgi:NAD(P)H-dependent FMN reductase
MEKRKILALVGGIGSQSLNQKLFKVFQELAPPNFELQQFPMEKIPFFSQDLEKDPPALVRDLRAQIKDSDAILIISPEYNRSLPGVLKNAILKCAHNGST